MTPLGLMALFTLGNLIMFGGLTVALVTGVPLGTLIGQHFGWRESFLAVFLGLSL